MEFGVLKDQKAGKVVIMCMKCLSTILAPYTLKNAMQMIHMLEGMLTISIFQQFFEIVKLFTNSDCSSIANRNIALPIIILCLHLYFVYTDVKFL